MNIPALIAAIAFLILMIGLTVALLTLSFEFRKSIQKVNAEIDKVAEITSLLVGPAKDVIATLGKLNAYIKEPLEVALPVLGSIFLASRGKPSRKETAEASGDKKFKTAVMSLLGALLTAFTPSIVEKLQKRKATSDGEEEV
jgi:H+/gluconate symporter-like permease